MVYCLVQQRDKFHPWTNTRLSEQFVDYFIQEIVTIHNGLCQITNTDNKYSKRDVISTLASLSPAANEEVSKMIRLSAWQSYDLYYISTWLLKLCPSELLTVITYIVGLSLSTSTPSFELKLALITPVLKKVLMAPGSLRTSALYPISHIDWKITKGVLVERLNQQLIQNCMHEVLKSTYKHTHSSHRALFKVQNDLLMVIDACCFVQACCKLST